MVLVMVGGIAELGAQSAMGPPPGLLILPARTDPAAPAAAFPGEQLRQMLTVRLVNRGMYRVVSPLAVEAALRREELLPSDLDDPEVLWQMAEELDMDYVLYSSLSITAGAGNWAVQLTSPDTGETVWSTIIAVPPQRPMEAVRAVTEQLDTFGRDVRLVQIGDIRSLVDAGEVSRAETLYRRYVETRPTTPDTDTTTTAVFQMGPTLGLTAELAVLLPGQRLRAALSLTRLHTLWIPDLYVTPATSLGVRIGRVW